MKEFRKKKTYLEQKIVFQRALKKLVFRRALKKLVFRILILFKIDKLLDWLHGKLSNWLMKKLSSDQLEELGIGDIPTDNLEEPNKLFEPQQINYIKLMQQAFEKGQEIH